jgi:hypothetical protein
MQQHSMTDPLALQLPSRASLLEQPSANDVTGGTHPQKLCARDDGEEKAAEGANRTESPVLQHEGATLGGEANDAVHSRDHRHPGTATAAHTGKMAPRGWNAVCTTK